MFMLADIIGPPLVKLVGDVLNRVLPPEKMTEKERADLEQAVTLEVLQADWQQVAGQLATNLEESKSESLFVSGWRPFVGWTCGSALAWVYVLQPFLAFGLGSAGVHTPPLPEVDMTTLLPLLMGLLGLGGLRTYEKVQGVNKAR